MFNIVTPHKYDRIFINCFPSPDANYISVSLLLTRNGTVQKIGIPPSTYGGDRFKNKNCDHLNLKGNLVMASELDAKRVASAYYNSKPTGGYFVWLPDWLVFGTKPKTQTVIYPKQDFSYTTPNMYFNYWPRWYEYVYSIAIKWSTDRRVRVDVRTVITTVGQPSSRTCKRHVTYMEFNEEFTKVRSRQYSNVGEKEFYPLWIDLSLNTYSSISTSSTYLVTQDAPEFPYRSPDIYLRTKGLREKLRRDDSSSFGQLGVETAQGLKVIDFKLGLFLADWFKIGSVFTSFASTLKNVGLKSLSTAYLSYHYGLRLTYNDTKDFFDSFRRTVEAANRDISIARGRLNRTRTITEFGVSKTVTDRYNMMLYCSVFPIAFARFCNKLLVADFFPTTELVWDMIPFSFVVDWFLKVGDELEALDSRTLLSTYDIHSCVYSRRSEVTYLAQELFPGLGGVYQGEITIVDFHRIVSPTCPPYQPFSGIMPTQPFNHWIEGAALIVQRTL